MSAVINNPGNEQAEQRGEVSFNILKLLRVSTVLLCCSPTMAGYNWSSSAARAASDPARPSPAFDDLAIRHVDAATGQTLLLPCTVRYLGDKVVSWIRSKDLHILTSGPHTFSGDNRFEAVSSPAGDFWGLRIRGVLESDAGRYECQVNTDPKMSLAINLTVSGGANLEGTNSKWVGRALIKGPREVYVRDGSPVTLACEISPLSVASALTGVRGVFMTAKPEVRWLRDSEELFFQEEDPRISTDTRYGETDWKVTSVLKISETTWRDSGQYTCLQMSVKPDSVRLFVTEGEHSEAMQRDYPVASIAGRSASSAMLILLFVLSFPT